MPVLRHRLAMPGAGRGIRLACGEALLAVAAFAALCVLVLSVAPQLDVEPDDGAYQASIVAITEGHFLTLSGAEAHALAGKLGQTGGAGSAASAARPRRAFTVPPEWRCCSPGAITCRRSPMPR